MKKTKHTKNAKGALLKLRDKNQTDDEFRRNLCLVTGTSTKTGAELALNQMASMQVWNRDKKEPERVLAAVDMIAEFAPKNALETLLAVQMFGVHKAALRLCGESCSRAGHSSLPASVARLADLDRGRSSRND